MSGHPCARKSNAKEATAQANIRPATIADVPFIQDIARRTFEHTYRGIIPENDQKEVLSHAYSEEALAISISRHKTFLVAEAPGTDGGGLAGYVDIDFDGKKMELHRLYVLPQYQRRGLGRRLLEAAVSKTLGDLTDSIAGPLLLVAHVQRDNAKARAFYKKVGFTEGEEKTMAIGGASLPVIEISMTLGVPS